MKDQSKLRKVGRKYNTQQTTKTNNIQSSNPQRGNKNQAQHMGNNYSKSNKWAI